MESLDLPEAIELDQVKATGTCSVQKKKPLTLFLFYNLPCYFLANTSAQTWKEHRAVLRTKGLFILPLQKPVAMFWAMLETCTTTEMEMNCPSWRRRCASHHWPMQRDLQKQNIWSSWGQAPEEVAKCKPVEWWRLAYWWLLVFQSWTDL